MGLSSAALGVGVGGIIAGVAFAALAEKVGGVDIAMAMVSASALDLIEDFNLFVLKTGNGFLNTGAKILMFFNRVKTGVENEFIDIKTFALVTFNNIVDGIAKLLNSVFGTAYDASITVTKNAGLQAARDLAIGENNQKLAEFEARMTSLINDRNTVYNALKGQYDENHRQREERIAQMYYERNYGGDPNDYGDIDDLLDQYNSVLDSIAGSVGDIADNTEEIKNNQDIADLIRDYHARQYTQRNTTQYITIDMSGQVNNISSSMDVAQVTDYMVNSVREAVAVTPEGA